MPAPLPQHLCDRARLLSTIHPRRTVMEILHVSSSTLHLMKKRGYRAAPGTKPFKRLPYDFAIQAHHATREELAAHYRTSLRCIRRWMKEIGR